MLISLWYNSNHKPIDKLPFGGYGMNKFRTIVSVIVMVVAGIIGLFAGAFFNDTMGGATLFSLVAGIACIVYTIDNREQ